MNGEKLNNSTCVSKALNIKNGELLDQIQQQKTETIKFKYLGQLVFFVTQLLSLNSGSHDPPLFAGLSAIMQSVEYLFQCLIFCKSNIENFLVPSCLEMVCIVHHIPAFGICK